MLTIHKQWRNQRHVPAPKGVLRKFAAAAAGYAGLPIRPDWDLNLLFVDDALMAKYNSELVGHIGTTDVITFNYFECGENWECGDTMVELIINPDAAEREGEKYDGYSREMALYLVHGLLHCAGEDDLTPEAVPSMRRREQECLDLLAGDFDFRTVFPDSIRR